MCMRDVLQYVMYIVWTIFMLCAYKYIYMRGLHIAVALGTLSLTGLAGAGVGVGWFLNAADCHQDRISSRTKPSAPSLS